MRIKLLLLLILSLGTIYSQTNDSLFMQKKPLEQVFKEYQQELLSIPGVQGFYQTTKENGEECIVIMVDMYSETVEKAVPDSIEGYPVIVEATGEIKPLQNKPKK